MSIMLPPLLTDRTHKNIFLPSYRGPLVRNHSLENELFDYHIVAARAIKPHRPPLCNLQMPIEGSLLSPQANFFPPPLTQPNYTPAPERKLITELKRPNHVKNSHKTTFVNPNSLYFQQAPVQSSRIEYTQMRPRPMAEEYYEVAGYPTLLQEQAHHNVQIERKKINTLISGKHARTQSNVLLPSQSTKNLPASLHTDPWYLPENTPKHVSALEKYNIKLVKETSKKTGAENVKPQAPVEETPVKTRKSKNAEENSKKEEEPSPTLKSKHEDKKHVTHYKSSSNDMRKQAILNNAQRKSRSDPKLEE